MSRHSATVRRRLTKLCWKIASKATRPSIPATIGWSRPGRSWIRSSRLGIGRSRRIFPITKPVPGDRKRPMSSCSATGGAGVARESVPLKTVEQCGKPWLATISSSPGTSVAPRPTWRFSRSRERNFNSKLKKTFPSKQYPRLEPVVEEFLAGQQVSISRACFGIAGPVVDGQVKTPNLPWVVNSAKIAQRFKLDSVALLNDLEAAAYGIFTLESQELFTLNEGVSGQRGNKVLIAAGTGLGEATLYDDGRDHHPSASEGGHGDFAPTDETQIDLLRYLIKKFRHVSYERVVSGPGIANIYGFFRDSGRLEEPDWLREKISAAEDMSAVISHEGLAGSSDIVRKRLVYLCRFTAPKRAIWLCGARPPAVFISAAASRRKSLPSSKMELSCAPSSTKVVTGSFFRPCRCELF